MRCTVHFVRAEMDHGPIIVQAAVPVSFFVGPPSTAEISCLPTCQGPDNPPRYPTVNADEYTQALIEQYHRTGRPGIAATTASRFKRQ